MSGEPGYVVLARNRAAGFRSSVHGEDHWKRVAHLGLFLCRRTRRADREVVLRFAALHDCCRHDDGHDPDHGRRAAAFADEHAEAIGLDPEQHEQLVQALAGHVDGQTTTDPTIGVCWDADRLDLIRLGIVAAPEFMSTAWGPHPLTAFYVDQWHRGLLGPQTSPWEQLAADYAEPPPAPERTAYYHCGLPTARGGIRSHGLDAGRATESPWGNGGMGMWPEGVYLWDTLDLARWYAREACKEWGGFTGALLRDLAQVHVHKLDIWQVQIDDQDVIPDPAFTPGHVEYGHAYYTTEAVPPHRVHLLEAGR